jgi:3-phosphoshikimate 1-carboxyvinyltransferase
MQAIIHPSVLKGTLQAPASKSSMQRACAAALVSAAKTIIKNPGHSNDDKAALEIIKTLGCQCLTGKDQLFIDSANSLLFSRATQATPVTAIHCGESGLGMRMFAPILALSPREFMIDGEGSLLNRPMDFFDEILPRLEVEVKSNNGKLPLYIKGPLVPQNIRIDGSLSSQFLTGLLFAYAASGASNVSIKVNNLKSKPYIDLTLKVMREFGLRVPENIHYQEFYFSSQPSNKTISEAVHYSVEGDWSGGAFLLVAGVISGNIRVRGLDLLSTQADKMILEALKDCGSEMMLSDDEIMVSNSSILRSFRFDATDCPDLFPPLVALAAYCRGQTIIKGVHRLEHKESNRALTLQQEFSKTGLDIILQDDFMVINATGVLKGATVHSRHDHRIAMACTVAALGAESQTIIDEAEAINKSYPDFYEHLQSMGASITTKQLIHK